MGYQYLTKDLYSFIWTIKAQYYQLFQRFRDSGKFTNLQIITQGYDYALPTYKTRWKKWYALQPILNQMINSGKWLIRPLMIKGITDEEISRKILKAIIFEVNFLFADLAQTFANVYHIDCRGTAMTFDDWFDELHLHSEKFKQIAEAYKKCIEKPPGNKVIKVALTLLLTSFL
ncbi:hypothetical protein AHMF7605_00385 [Adhaeribacter arboris]|uniref:Uncharacterized protein n=1 Tax=Adhaeribacter arboris TaxID=2072846 RepID=A0A2T2Y9A5_9BACT|nr:hypothetical protein [Adhaeribacter arboris]PSR52083.1 hypothetical protein AHMF7605_00385 [Adhaeribacter arboris]